MRGLHSVAWRGLKRRKARSLLTGIAIALGVANVFGVFATNASIDRGLEQRTRSFETADALAYVNRAEDADSSLLAETRDQLRRLPEVRGVALRWGALILDAPRKVKDDIYLGASDAPARREFLHPRLERGRLPRIGMKEVVLSASSAKVLGKDVGDIVTTHTAKLISSRRQARALYPNTERLAKSMPAALEFRVTGIARDPVGTQGNPCCGNVASLEYIWRITGQRPANQIDFFLEPSVDSGRWVAEREPDLPHLHFEASSIGPELRRFLTTLQGTLAGTSVLALFIGAFLIYLTFSIAVVERTRLYGMFHAIGAGGKDVARGVFTEALAIGAISTAGGLAIGYGLASLLGRLVQRIVPVDISAGPTITSSALAAAIVVGLLATTLGAAIPALRAARMSPVQAIRGTDDLIARPSKTWLVGVALIVIGVAFATTGTIGTNVVTTVATLGVLIGSILIVPPLLGILARLTRRVARRLNPGLADVAVSHVSRERNRSAYTLALVMLVLAAILTLSATDRSLHGVADKWIDKRFGADLFLYGPQLTDKLARKLDSVPGVAGLTSVDFGSRVSINKPARLIQNLVVIEPKSFFAVAGFPWSEGTDAGSRRALVRGGSVLIPSRIAGRLRVHVGDRLELYYASRTRSFVVAGIYSTLAEGPEVGVVASRTDASFFRPDRYHDAIYLNYASGVYAQTMERRLTRVLAPNAKRPVHFARVGESRAIGRYSAITGAAIKRNAQRDLSAYLRIFLAVILIAAVVGILGMANTLAASVLARFREIGVLQAIGASPRQIRRMIVLESAILTSAAFMLSVGIGAILSWMFNKGAARQVGFPIPFVFPWRTIPTLAIVSVVIALIAAFVPARRAERLTPVEALRYE